MLLSSKSHTVGDTTRWVVDYTRALENTAAINSATVTSSSTTCTTNNEKTQGKEVEFFLTGGALGEALTVSVQVTDSIGNIRNDTIAFTVVAP
jgi:hypothetical protein